MKDLTRKTSTGFTLVEMLVMVVIFGIALLATYAFIFRSYRVEDYTIESIWATEHARKAMEIMVCELREARDGDNGDFVIENVSDTSITFYSDIDHDDLTEKIRYFLDPIDNTILKRGEIEPTGPTFQYLPENEERETIARYIRNSANPIFKNYNQDYPGDQTTPVTEAETRYIKIHLEVNVNPERDPVTFELDSDVHLRNLKENF